MEATQIIHWPGRDVPACDKHANQLQRVAEMMGFPVSSSIIIAGGHTCTNCENEDKKTNLRIEE